MSEIIPTPREFAINMRQYITEDIETTHSDMDDLMVELLRQLGYGEAMDIFESQLRWYA